MRCKIIALLLFFVLLCSCNNTSPNSPDDPPQMDELSTKKSARDTSLTEHKDEVKELEKESKQQYPSHFSDHIMTKSPSDSKDTKGNRQSGSRSGVGNK